ncbi:hypothetical protein EG329_011932 [Mollisiaceae sp. DMI_Dod_QoI]|nr:hypothetical protein EG329_011932 [Helotiales sp. DMI_Dod_QoI]
MQNLNWNADDYTQAFRNWYSWRIDLVVWETIFDDGSLLPAIAPPEPKAADKLCWMFKNLDLDKTPHQYREGVNANHWPWTNETGNVQYAVTFPRDVHHHIFRNSWAAPLPLSPYIFRGTCARIRPIEIVFDVKIEMAYKPDDSEFVLWVQASTKAASMHPAPFRAAQAWKFLLEYKREVEWTAANLEKIPHIDAFWRQYNEDPSFKAVKERRAQKLAIADPKNRH